MAQESETWGSESLMQLLWEKIKLCIFVILPWWKYSNIFKRTLTGSNRRVRYLQVIEGLHLHDRAHGADGKGHLDALVRAQRGQDLQWTGWSQAKASRDKKEERTGLGFKQRQNKDRKHAWSHLFLLNWMAKSVMTLIALLVRVISIWMTPDCREKVPEISKPLPFAAGSQTWQRHIMRHFFCRLSQISDRQEVDIRAFLFYLASFKTPKDTFHNPVDMKDVIKD